LRRLCLGETEHVRARAEKRKKKASAAFTAERTPPTKGGREGEMDPSASDGKGGDSGGRSWGKAVGLPWKKILDLQKGDGGFI